MLYDLLCKRSEDKGFRAEATELLSLVKLQLCDSHGADGGWEQKLLPPQQPQKNQQFRRLVAALKKMTFTELLGLALRGGPALTENEETSTAEVETRAALSRLRLCYARLNAAA